MTLDHPHTPVRVPLIMAHRGDSLHAPANTVPALARAVTAGADVLETDVHWTKDNVLVLSHDPTVDAITEDSGGIRDMTLAELQSLDFGYRFTPDGGKSYPYRGRGVQVVTLSEALQLFPHVRWNIDVKPKTPHSIKQLLVLLATCQALHRVVLASFHHVTLHHLRLANAQIATSASPREVGWFAASHSLCRESSQPYVALQVPDRVAGIRLATPSFIRAAHDAGVQVHVWTVDEPTAMREWMDKGIDGIVTDDPGRGVQVRTEWLARHMKRGKG